MTDWTDTAKRLLSHPKFQAAFQGASGVDLCDWLKQNGTCIGGILTVPTLTHWPTAGVLMGMVVELGVKAGIRFELSQMDWGPWRVFAYRGDVDMPCEVKAPDRANPGQALAELWLELVGEG